MIWRFTAFFPLALLFLVPALSLDDGFDSGFASEVGGDELVLDEVIESLAGLHDFALQAISFWE